MNTQKTSINKLRVMALELVLDVDNVINGAHHGVISYYKAAELYTVLARRYKDLVLHEQKDPEVREIIRTARLTLLPFYEGPPEGSTYIC
jgi:hypothetical protein